MTAKHRSVKKGDAKGITGWSENLPVDVKVGILHTIADAIYATPPGKIREAVANARDNDATWIIINVDPTTNSISIFDNGCGISKKRFEEIFRSIGYGLLRHDDEKKLSYFGIGLMSIFQLGKHVKLFTRPRGNQEMLQLTVDTGWIFDKAQEKEPLSRLRDVITLQPTNLVKRAALPVPMLDSILESKSFGGFPDNFTEIVIEDVSAKDMEEICRPEFENELRKILPLRVEPEEPFMKRFVDTGTRRKIQAILTNPDFCKTIDVHFGIQSESGIHQVWKYFPSFKHQLLFPEANVISGVSKGKDFAFYVVHTIAEDLQDNPENRETGFWVRNQNFLVRGPHFLQKPGPGRPIIQEPIRAWVFGEVFHKDMNSFLTVSRNDFLYYKPEFEEFRNEVFQLFSPLNDKLRSIWQTKNTVKNDLIMPFAQLAEPEGTLKKMEERLRRLVGPKVEEQEFQEEMLARLTKLRSSDIERQETRVDLLLEKSKRPILLGEDENVTVRIDPALRGKVQDFQATWDINKNRVVVSVSPNLFDPRPVVFLNHTFTLYFVVNKKTASGISINSDQNTIYVNPFNEDLLNYSISILDVYVALEIADAVSNNKRDMKKNLLALLGQKEAVASQYITPLGEDLSRTLEFTRSGA